MSKTSQQRPVARFRKRLAERGLVRFDVTGREADRELVRTLARRLAKGDSYSERLRAVVIQAIGGTPLIRGGNLRALLASPLVGSRVDLARPRDGGRKVDI